MRISARDLNRPGDIHSSSNLPPENIKYIRKSKVPIVVVALIGAVVVAIVVLKMGQPKTDHQTMVINELRTIHRAQETYFSMGDRNAYGNFDELVKNNLLPPKEGSYHICPDCAPENVWYGKNSDYLFQVVRNDAANGYCVTAAPRKDSDKAYAVGPQGIIYEDSKDRITCAGASNPWRDPKSGTGTPQMIFVRTPEPTPDHRNLKQLPVGR